MTEHYLGPKGPPQREAGGSESERGAVGAAGSEGGRSAPQLTNGAPLEATRGEGQLSPAASRGRALPTPWLEQATLNSPPQDREGTEGAELG